MIGVLGAGIRLEPDEFTLEANPDPRDAPSLEGWRDAGVTRLSIGVQSFDDRMLGILGRPYTAPAGRGVRQERAPRGIPGRRDRPDDRRPDRNSGCPPENDERGRRPRAGPCFPLHHGEPRRPPVRVVRPRTSRWRTTRPPTPTSSCGRGWRPRASGDTRSRTSPGKARSAVHNLKYWRYEPFLGLGPSACSHIGAVRWCNKPAIEDWAAGLAPGGDPRGEVRELAPNESLREALISGLRLAGGVRTRDLEERFGIDFTDAVRHGRSMS